MGMKPTTYYQSLSVSEKVEYAIRAGTTIRHMQSMFTPAGFRKRPRDRLIIGIVDASNGAISLDEAIDYFLVAPVRKLAAELAPSSVPSYASSASAPLAPISLDKRAGYESGAGV